MTENFNFACKQIFTRHNTVDQFVTRELNFIAFFVQRKTRFSGLKPE